MVPDDVDSLEEYRSAPRSAKNIGEDVYAVSDRADRFIAELRSEKARRELDAAVTGPPRTVGVRIDGRFMVDCQINAAWAAQATAPRLMDEFYVAVQRAKDESEAASPSLLEGEKQALMAELNSLTRESLAALRYLAEGWP